MQLEVFAQKKEKGNTLYFCGISLKDYISQLPEDFMDYNVQRGIVTNVYLDNLIDTILNRGHIPPITLVSGNLELISDVKNTKTLSVISYKILDGLQRTVRLKMIWETIRYLNRIIESGVGFDEIKGMSRYQLSRNFGKQLKEFGSTTLVLEKIVNRGMPIVEIEKCFDEVQWFEVWGNLSPEEEVEKMLILNAGHKQVSLKHQLELLFLNTIPELEELKSTIHFELIREKEVSSIQYSKNRKKGEFHFSHLITAALSFINKQTITPNANLVRKLQEEGTDGVDTKVYLTYNFLERMVVFLSELDLYLENKYENNIGLQWISRETVTVGLFAALGKFASEHGKVPPESIFDEFIYMLNNSDMDFLMINNYNEARSSLDLSRVNVGDVTKNAIFNGVYELFGSNFESAIRWEDCFRGVGNDDNK